VEAMALDKKTIGGRLRFVLPSALGAVELREVSAEQVAAVLEEGAPC
jgi:3-dehydroquinate synthetase